MGVVYRHHVAGRIIGSTRTRIREILEAVEARGMVVLLRVLDAQQVASGRAALFRKRLIQYVQLEHPGSIAPVIACHSKSCCHSLLNLPRESLIGTGNSGRFQYAFRNGV